MRAIIIDRILLPAAAFAALFALRCADLSGGGSEAGNARVIGRVMNVQGSPAGNVMVTVLSSDYDPVKKTAHPDSVFDTTGTDGRYGFTVQKGRTYTIQAVHMTLRTRALIAGIAVGDTDITAPQCTLNAPGAIKVRLPDSSDKTLGYLFVPGTAVLTFLNNAAGFVVLDSVPGGIIPAVSYSSISIPASAVIRYDVPVIPGDTAVVYNPSWKYARRLFLNTTTGGANVSDDVYDFPVLVRLTAGNFTFAEAKADGTDIMFTKSDNTFFPFEIERWDAASQQAEIWVKVDTVFGNNDRQNIVMYWGNQGAADSSKPAAVFDTAAGFAGVWHLGQPAGAIVTDATSNGINGTATATATVSGSIGMAQSFNGTSSLIQTSASASDKVNFPDTGTYTVSAWVKANALDSLFHGIVFKSNFQFGLQMRPKNKWEFLTYIDKSRWEMSRSPASDNLWHALAGVRNGSKQYLYVDGICVDSSIVNVASNIARAYDQPLQIGHCPDGGNDPDRYFNGSIDEVRISKVAYGADWIKLCHMNQKGQDALVKW
jgi:hypothetical protein